jgi:YD repeat-containing protein
MHAPKRIGCLLAPLCCVAALAETFVYDDAGRLRAATQANGLTQSYTYDAEANLVQVRHLSTDTSGTGGSGNGIPDWWEYFYFGQRGIDPLASPAHDGIGNLMKFALGLDPTLPSFVPPVAFVFESFVDGKVYPFVQFVRSRDAASTLAPEQSLDLVSWQSGSSAFVLVSATDLGDGTEFVIMRSLIPRATTSRLFFRLKVDAAR